MNNNKEIKAARTVSIEEAKDYLKGYQKAMYEFKEADEILDSFKEESLYPSMTINFTPKSRSGKSDLSNLMVKAEKLERKYAEKKYKAFMKLEEIRSCINQLECHVERKVLTLRYIKFMKWEDICEEVSYSYKHVHNIHRKALSKLEVKKCETR